MGRHCALQKGLPVDVAEAIYESVLPRFAGDILPRSSAGVLVSLADKVDSLVGLIAAVGPPSASADPYGLRRSAYGMLQVCSPNKSIRHVRCESSRSRLFGSGARLSTIPSPIIEILVLSVCSPCS